MFPLDLIEKQLISNMKTITDSLRVIEFPMNFMGLELGRRVSILQLRKGQWLIHSTGPFSPGDVEQIRALGSPVAMMETTTLHDTFSREGQAAFPDLPYMVPESFPRKRLLEQAMPLTESRKVVEDSVTLIRLQGMRSIEEWTCFHPPSRTLIVGDLLLNLTYFKGWQAWAMRHLARVKSWPAIDLPFRMAIKDKTAFQASLQAIAALDFDRIVPAHGAIIEAGAKPIFYKAAEDAGIQLN